MTDDYTPCGLGPCAAPAGHDGTCAQASGWDKFTDDAKDASYEAGFAAGRAAALAEQCEVEWEYGLVNETARPGEYGPHDRAHLVSRNREHIERQQRRGHPSIRVMRRRAAGEWVPVNENGETP